jgi:Fur family transcriptional regulator, ferric uptake regulator
VISRLERLALQRRLRIGPQRRIILQILEAASDQPTAQEIYQRAQTSDRHISLSTIRHTLAKLTEAGLLRRLKPPRSKARYEKAGPQHRESLIDAGSGRQLEFRSEGIEGLLQYAVQQLGYRLLDYRLELFGVPEPDPGKQAARTTGVDSPIASAEPVAASETGPQLKRSAARRPHRKGRH